MLTRALVSSTSPNASQGALFIIPMLSRANAANSAVKVPHMNTSPCAKLIMNRMP